MICGAEDLVSICQDKIAKNPHELSADGKFSWEEVECLGACANAPMAQIGKDYYEDLTADKLVAMLDDLAAGKVPTPGSQSGRFAAEPLSGLTSLKGHESGKTKYNASVQLATDIGDTVKRIDGTEVPLLTPWQGKGANKDAAPAKAKAAPKTPTPKKPTPAAKSAKIAADVGAVSKAKPKASAPAKAAETAPSVAGKKPRTMKAPRKAGADDLKMIKGVGPKLENMLNGMGFFHFDQVSKWGADEIAWVDQNLEGFKGRVTRDNWVPQAVRLAAGEETEFSARASKDGTYKDRG
jgi:NADH-quinone oxidoreductase subunit E